MPSNPTHLRRLRRRPTVTVTGALGLVEGELWWVEPNKVTIWCAEELSITERYQIRIDLGMSGGNLDAAVRVTDRHDRSEARVRQGYVHSATFELTSPSDWTKLQEALASLNPELRLQEPAPTPPPPTPTVTTRERRARQRADATRSHSHRGDGRRSAAARARRSAERPHRPERPTRGGRPAREQRRSGPNIVLAPGTPPSLLVHLTDSQALRAHLRTTTGRVQLHLGPVDGLTAGAEVLLVLQLPNGAFVQFAARTRCHPSGIQVEANRPDAASLALIEAAQQMP